MSGTFADGAFDKPVSKRLYGIARLGKRDQRHRLMGDMQQWLDSGHHVKQLPPGPVTYAGKIDSFAHLVLETGFMHEF